MFVFIIFFFAAFLQTTKTAVTPFTRWGIPHKKNANWKNSTVLFVGFHWHPCVVGIIQ